MNLGYWWVRDKESDANEIVLVSRWPDKILACGDDEVHNSDEFDFIEQVADPSGPLTV